MKEVTIYNIDGTIQSPNNIFEDPAEWIEFCKKTNVWGKNERWVRAKVLSENENGDPIEIFPDEVYEENQVIETEERPIDPDDSGVLGEWVKLRADYIIEIVDYVPPVPKSISPAQARKALTFFGLRSAVESAIAASTNQDLKDDWEYAGSIERENPGLNAMAAGLNISTEQLDELFRYGATL